MAECGEAVMRVRGLAPQDPGPTHCERCSQESDGNRLCFACQSDENRMGPIVSHIPRAYLWATFDAPLLAERVAMLERHRAKLMELPPRAVLVGPAGSGKSSVLAAMVRLGASRGRWPRFAHAFELARARAVHRLGDGEPEQVTRCMNADILALDDLGNERKTELSAVEDVVFERHAEDLPLWVTTPFGPDELAKRYGDGLARRVYERSAVFHLGKV